MAFEHILFYSSCLGYTGVTMPIIKCRSYIDAYRYKAKSRYINELSGRMGRPDLTNFINQQIINKLFIDDDDVVIDIGCGDGTLLKKSAKIMRYGVGVLPTDEEIERVRLGLNGHANIEIVRGTAQSTSLPSELGSKIVCNGVILLLDKDEVESALKEIVRISRPGALVYIGEIPPRNEFENRNYGDSVTKWLLWVARHQGVKVFFNRFLKIGLSIMTEEPFIIEPKTQFYSRPDAFIKMAENCGLIHQDNFVHQEITTDGKIQDHANKIDYIFKTARR